VKQGLALLTATVTILLAIKLVRYVSRPLGLHAYHLWLVGGLVYLVCSLAILLEAPVRRVLCRVAWRLFARRAAGRLG
jgi:hypothetical protein